MILKCLASGSSGNCYVLKDSTGKMLILDAGIPWKEIQIGIDFRPIDVEAVCITHSHSDHARAVRDLNKVGIRTILPWESENAHRGFYTVKPFPLTDSTGRFVHTNQDGSSCPVYGFLVEHPEMGRMVYLTDCEFCKWKFKRINHILVECNYDRDLINPNAPNSEHVYRGHMELSTAVDFIRSNASGDLQNIMLCHVGSNLDPDVAIRRVVEGVPNNPKTIIVERGKDYVLSGSYVTGNNDNRHRKRADFDSRSSGNRS